MRESHTNVSMPPHGAALLGEAGSLRATKGAGRAKAAMVRHNRMKSRSEFDSVGYDTLDTYLLM
jgi:hypothetical protein